MKQTRSFINIKTINLGCNQNSLYQDQFYKKNCTKTNSSILQLLDKESKKLKYKYKKKNKNLLSCDLSNKNLLVSRNYKNFCRSTLNLPITQERNKIRLSINFEKGKNKNKKPKNKKHFSSDQIYTFAKNKNLDLISKQLKDSKIKIYFLMNDNHFFKLKSLRSDSKKLLKSKIENKENCYMTIKSNSNYKNEQSNSSALIFPSPQKSKFTQKNFSLRGRNNISNINNITNSYDKSISNVTFSQDYNINMNNKLVFKKNEEKVHKIIKIYSKNHKHKNSNVLNSLEKLKKKTKNVLNAYLSYINKDK